MKNRHSVLVRTNDDGKEISISPKSGGYGSSVNGGELLLLALATCFFNHLFRGAGRRNLVVSGVDVIVTADFDAEGEAGSNFRYLVDVQSPEPQDEIESLIRHTDSIAEIHKTLRKGISITLA